ADYGQGPEGAQRTETSRNASPQRHAGHRLWPGRTGRACPTEDPRSRTRQGHRQRHDSTFAASKPESLGSNTDTDYRCGASRSHQSEGPASAGTGPDESDGRRAQAPGCPERTENANPDQYVGDGRRIKTIEAA